MGGKGRGGATGGDARPKPLTSEIEPPVRVVLAPALIVMRPPTLVAPLMAPAAPASASPVATVTAPLLLPLLVPDEKEIAPLDPLAPALALRMLKEPLDVALP